MNFEHSLAFAQKLDRLDPLAHMRQDFFIPPSQLTFSQEELYFCGNSLGLQPKLAKKYVIDEMEKWQNFAVKGHFSSDYPWMPYHEFLTLAEAELVGARPEEVVVMNSLTVNLHLMLVSFYRPSAKKYKILLEDQAFPSDLYAISSQMRFHGYHPEDALITIKPRPGECRLHLEDWLEIIQGQGDSLALILLPGVQYFTGQVMAMPKIIEAAHQKGCLVGLDLAHAVGNIPLKLHEWQADFACWCHYKYLNSGPGAVAGCFIHSQQLARYEQNPSLPRFEGWWGHQKESRFLMEAKFHPSRTAEGWQLSNPPILSLAAIRASLDTFAKAGGLAPLREKSIRLTGFLAYLLEQKLSEEVQVLTPSKVEERGCQLSLAINPRFKAGKALYHELTAKGITTDWREPNVIRVAPVPLYNSFEEVYRFVELLKESVSLTS